MSEVAGPAPAGARTGVLGRIVSDPVWQARLARLPLVSRLVRHEGEALFDLVAGFTYSQVLRALVELDVPGRLRAGPAGIEALSAGTGVPAERMEVLVRAGIALGLLRPAGGGRVRLGRRGAALAGVPGLAEMVRHHDLLYRDLADPVALLRGGAGTETARFWPYVAGRSDPDAARRYSELMAVSQALVSAETLDAADLSGTRALLDLGGGSGAFALAAARRHPALSVTVLDLPDVAPEAERRIESAALSSRVSVAARSFLDPLPRGHDAVSLVRVLYDHGDETVRRVLSNAHAALPPGGLLLISEPMTGGRRPSRPGDVYFALYTMAMGTGQARSAERIAALCREAGFVEARVRPTRRPFVTGVVTARKT